MRHNPFCSLVLGGFLTLGIAPAQAPRPSCEVWLRDGRELPADRIEGGATGEWVLESAGRTERIAAREVLAVLGARAVAPRLPHVQLAGGDVCYGLVAGGDEAGDELWLVSPVLGRLQVAVDRLECLVARDGVEAGDLELPDGVQEAMFFPAALGFDRQAGTLHRFGSEGLRFQPEGEASPRWVAVQDLVGLRLSGAEAPAETPVAELCTRAGDRVGAASFRFTGASMRVALVGVGAGTELSVSLRDLGCLLPLDADCVHVSRLEPKLRRESAVDGDALWPVRVDRAATGSALAVGGRTVARGLGVHSRSRLVYKVPDGAAQFLTWVGFDDSALELAVRGDVEITVQVGARAPIRVGLGAGDAARRVGPLPVAAGEELSLEVDFGKGRDLGDRVDWLLPVFLRAQ